MFDIGFAELILLAGLGLIVLGPQRLPRVAAQLGRWVGQARRMSRTLLYQLRQEVNLDDPRPFSTGGPSTAGGAGSAGKATATGSAKAAGQGAKSESADDANPATKTESAEAAGAKAADQSTEAESGEEEPQTRNSDQPEASPPEPDIAGRAKTSE